jgi:hypothetical protein
MPADKRSLIRPRNVLLALIAVLVIAIGSYGYFLANMGGYLPWQEDPTPISNDITPFAGAGFENLPTTPPKRSPTAEPTSAASPGASPAASPDDAVAIAAMTISAQPTEVKCEVCD